MSVLQAIMQLVQDYQEVKVVIQELPFYPEVEETTGDPFRPGKLPLLSSLGDT